MTKVYQSFHLANYIFIVYESTSMINVMGTSVKYFKQKEIKEDPIHFFKHKEGMMLFEGDIILTEEQKLFLPLFRSYDIRSRRSYSIKGFRKVVQTWPNAVVPYQMSYYLDEEYKRIFRIAMNIIENGTCIKFIPRTWETKYVYLEKNYNRACLSHLGYTGSFQKVTMADHCTSVGSALHELGHTLGLWHEHSRLDRDDYIEILYHNLRRPDDSKHFAKVSREMFESVPNVGYDLESVMHYSPFAFAKKGAGLRTIKIKDAVDLDGFGCSERLPMGQRQNLSFKDKKRLNLLYKCPNTEIEEPICVTNAATPTTTSLPTSATPSTNETTPTYTLIASAATKLNGTTWPYHKLEYSLLILTIMYHSCLINKTGQGAQQIKIQDAQLRNGDLIIPAVTGNLTSSENYGIKCTPTNCQLTPCHGSSCKTISNTFLIIKADSNDRETIQSGDSVVLMSAAYQSYFLSCTASTKCVLSKCSNSSRMKPMLLCHKYSSSCYHHKFQILGTSKKKYSHLHTSQKVLFRRNAAGRALRDAFLLCGEENCKLRTNERDCAIDHTNEFKDVDYPNHCSLQLFKIAKIFN